MVITLVLLSLGLSIETTTNIPVLWFSFFIFSLHFQDLNGAVPLFVEISLLETPLSSRCLAISLACNA